MRKRKGIAIFKKALAGGLSALGCLAFLFGPGLGQSRAAQGAAQDMTAAAQSMSAAAKDFQAAEEEFNKAAGANSSQTNTQVPFTNLSQRSAQDPARAYTGSAAPARSMTDPANPALHGSPETGWAGTWTDPQTGDIITSVIAPSPSNNSQAGQQYPIIVEPNVGSWGSSGGSGIAWDGQTGPWQTTPDNPGWGNPPGAPNPPPGGFNTPPGVPNVPSAIPSPEQFWPGQPFYPHPNLPPNFNPGYRPLHPPAPGHWQNPPNAPGMTPGWGVFPGQNPPPGGAGGWQGSGPNSWRPPQNGIGFNPPPGGGWQGSGPGSWRPPQNGTGFNPGPGIPPSWQRAQPPQGGPGSIRGPRGNW